MHVQLVYIIILELEKEEQAILKYSSYKTFNRAIAKSPSIFMIEINVRPLFLHLNLKGLRIAEIPI